MDPTIVTQTLLMFLTLLSAGQCQQENPTPLINITFEQEGSFLGLFEEQQVPLTFSLLHIDATATSGKLRLISRDTGVFEVHNLTEIDIESLDLQALPMNFTTVIEGIFIGITYVDVFYEDAVSEEGPGDPVASYNVKVIHPPTILNPLFNYLVFAWLIISYIMMGSRMQWQDIKERIRKPWALLLAMACQFFLMPLLAFALSKAFRLDDATALGLIMVGTCPGGWLSNIFSLLLDCDFVLSLTMTFCSTILAMGMMPFNLWLYARPLTIGSENLETPYLDLFLQIIYLVIPIGISMVIARFSSRFRKYCEKLLKPVATLCILIAVGLGVPAQLHIYQSASIDEWAVSALLPLLGCIAGLIIAKICCLERKQAVTVSLETGAQNSLLAATMLAFFYPFPEADLIGKVPYIMALLSLAEGIIVTICYLLARYVFCKDRFGKTADDDDDVGDDVEKVKGKQMDYLESNGNTEMKEISADDYMKSDMQAHSDHDAMCVSVGVQTAYTNSAYE